MDLQGWVENHLEIEYLSEYKDSKEAFIMNLLSTKHILNKEAFKDWFYMLCTKSLVPEEMHVILYNTLNLKNIELYLNFMKFRHATKDLLNL